MLIEQAIYKLLKDNSGVTALVAGRIFAGIWKQEVSNYPGVLYRAPADGRREIVRVLEGGCSLVMQPIHVFSAAKTYGQAATLDSLVCTALDEFRGTVTDTSVSPPGSIEIQRIFLTRLAHAHQFTDRTQLHEFTSEFNCHFIDPLRLS